MFFKTFELNLITLRPLKYAKDYNTRLKQMTRQPNKQYAAVGQVLGSQSLLEEKD